MGRMAVISPICASALRPFFCRIVALPPLIELLQKTSSYCPLLIHKDRSLQISLSKTAPFCLPPPSRIISPHHSSSHILGRPNKVDHHLSTQHFQDSCS